MASTDPIHELYFYTLSHPDREAFLHQHCVDAHTARAADSDTRPIALLYALVGLYLALEKQYSGTQVQQAHLHLSKDKKNLPAIALPPTRGHLDAGYVLSQDPGPPRDRAIRDWCASVWDAYSQEHGRIAAYCETHLP